MSILLKVQDICKSFPGVKALSDVSIEYETGEVHAMLGENGAGKTTLMRVICGIYQADSGQMFFEGEEVKFHNAKQSQEKGIAMIHQELNMPVNLSIAEYMFLGCLPVNKLGMVDRKFAEKKSKELLETVEVSRDPSTKIYELTVAEQQLVEIARALSFDSKLLIMDEPTSALNQQETENLFRIIRSLKKKDVTIIYISHKLDEIFRITDRITVMRDGCVIVTGKPTADCTHEMIVKLMTGKELNDNYFAKDEARVAAHTDENTIMSVREITSKDRNLRSVSFDLYEGEVLGIAGLLGAGRTELFKTIFGAVPKTGGEVLLNGKPVVIRNTSDAVNAGIMLVPEDRKTEGLILQMSIRDNIVVPSLSSISRYGLVDKKKGREISRTFVEKLRVKCTGDDAVVGNLSGGNQQKVVFAKWLAANPKVLMLDDPTRGIDVGSKHEIYGLVRELANQGIGVIFVSSEMPELVGVCDRVLVMRDGEIVCEAKGEEINENHLMLYATGK